MPFAMYNNPIPQRFTVLFSLVLNAASSIGIIFVNKTIFSDFGFPHGVLLTVIHFAVTFLLLLLCLALGVFEYKRVPVMKVIPLCVSFCGFVALTNMSLLYNSVGIYQLIKILTTPLLVVLQTLFYDQHFSSKVKASLSITCIGVAIATVSDTDANTLGTLIALSALLLTCQYQIWVGTKQKELACNSFQLLFYQAPISALMLLPISYFSDDLANNFYMPYTDTIWMILLSAVLAFLVNISIFLVIGKTSPVAYNVLGHVKLCVILLLGFCCFGKVPSAKAVIGIFLTLTGVFWYSYVRHEETKRAKAEEEHESSRLASAETHMLDVEVAGECLVDDDVNLDAKGRR